MVPFTPFRGCFPSNPNALSGGLFFCCSQLVPRKHGPRHSKCAGVELGYKVRGSFLELEFCPHQKCNCKFTDPQSNIHQEAVHRSIFAWICPVCEISFMSEGCLSHHILNCHNSPTGFVQDLDEHYGLCKPLSFSF